ncbi:IclR family transcriptional regulator [Bordetella petrii]|uniref:IclR family transcriptional regulator n=1 Tax=Bordetella petrii TaxID=94624 RepID=UPI00372E280A
MAERSGSGVRALSSVLKTLAVLDLLGASDRPLKLAELVAAQGGNRATVYQRLVTLIEAGWVEVDEDGAYRLTLHAARVGEAAFDQASLGERATAVLQELVYASGETASLAVISGAQVVLAKRVEAKGMLRADVHVGTTFSLEISASGRVLSAYAEPAMQQYLRDQGAALPDPGVMADVVAQGYAVSSGLEIPGILALAVPVLNRLGKCVAALSLVMPATRFDIQRLLPPLQAAAGKLNSLLAGAGQGEAGRAGE